MCPSAGAHGTGHVIVDDIVSVHTRPELPSSAVLACCELEFSKKLEAQEVRSFF